MAIRLIKIVFISMNRRLFTAHERLRSVLYVAMLLCFFLSPNVAYANLSGEVEYDYSRLNKKNNFDTVETINFFQRYSLLYEKEGLLKNGFLGSYDLKFGYTWYSNASERNGYESTISGDKFIYSGELNIAPGALPFRLTAYRTDLMKPHVVKTEVSDGLFPDQVNDYLFGVKSVTTGVSLIAGIKNGSYMGRYREALSQYPRLLIDYREVEVKGDAMQGIVGNRLDYKQQNLAFISLNKKDNWFHCKVYKFTDHVDTTNNLLRKQYLLGTIDHKNQRHWINLTNWLRMSVDGSLLTTAEGSDAPESTSWLINSYFSGAYEDMTGDVFLNYRRQRPANNEELTQHLSLPVYFKKDEYLRTWRTRFQFSQAKEENELTDVAMQRKQYDWMGRVDLDKQEKVVFTTGANATHKTGDWGEGDVVGAYFSWATNSRFRPKINWRLSADSQYATETDMDGTGKDSLSQVVRASLSGFTHRNRGRWAFGETLSYVDGSTDSINVNTLNPTNNSSSSYSIKSESWFEYEYLSRVGISNRFYGAFLYDQGRENDRWSLFLWHNLNYRTGNWSVNSNTSYRTNYGESTINDVVEDYDNYALIHNSRVKYRVNRVADYSGSLKLLRLEGENYGRQEITLAENINFHFYRKGLARGRKWLDISQGFEWERYENFHADSAPSDLYSLLGAVTYYYNRVVSLGSNFRYTFGDSEDGQFISRTWINVKYPLLSMRLAYSYGKNETVEEHYYEASMNKKF